MKDTESGKKANGPKTNDESRSGEIVQENPPAEETHAKSCGSAFANFERVGQTDWPRSYKT